MKKTFLVLSLLFFLISPVIAQNADKILEFDTEVHDFNSINEGYVAEHHFVFTNKSSKVVTLSSVQASCGCTTPSWSKEPIAPGKKGTIIASYNSEGRPGTFVKTVTVSYSEEGQVAQSMILTIKGNVLAKMAINAPIVNAIMTLDKTEHNFGKLQIGSKVAKTFTFKNTGTNDLSVSTIYSSCNCVTISPSKVIKAGDMGSIELIFSPTQVSNKDELVTIYTNSTTQPQVTVLLKAEILQNMSGQSMLKESDGF
jgi:Protein of unknown function (DUF1573)